MDTKFANAFNQSSDKCFTANGHGRRDSKTLKKRKVVLKNGNLELNVHDVYGDPKPQSNQNSRLRKRKVSSKTSSRGPKDITGLQEPEFKSIDPSGGPVEDY